MLHFGKVEHGVDQAGSAARWEVSGRRVQLGTGGLSVIGESVHVGERDNMIAVGDLDMLVPVVLGHDASTRDLETTLVTPGAAVAG